MMPGWGEEVDADLVDRATALRPLLAEQAARTESQRQVVPEVIEAVEDAGLFDVMLPKRLGGLGATMATELAVAAELGRACASTAWVQALINVTTWAVGRSPAGAELFDANDEGGRPRVAGVLASGGKALPASGGYLVSGQWAFASGSFYAGWFSGGVLVVDESGQTVGFGMALMARSELTIDDTWFVAGMCGTASNTVVADSVFVPANRLVLIGDETAAGDDPGDRWPLGSVLSLVLTGPLLGAARACSEVVIDKAPKRAISYTSYGNTVESMVALAEVARANLDIDSAWLHAFGAAAYIDAVGAGRPRDKLEEARLRGQCGYLTSMLRRGVETLLNVAGAGSFANVSTLQRNWRDINVGSRHAFLATNISFETYGRALFGLDPVLVMV